ncbi:MAG TPA: hypothetical protein VH639_15295 [Bryobacteraceae bacterium]|jgi:hypothetical protein
MQTTKFSQLSRPRQILIRLCQTINYGSILNLPVIEGEVRLNGVPEITFDLKLDENITSRPELDLPDFVLSVETCRLFSQIQALNNGVIEKIIVHDGIPRRAVLRGRFQGVRL